MSESAAEWQEVRFVKADHGITQYYRKIYI